MAIDNDEQDTPVFPGGEPLQIARWLGKREFKTLSAVSQRITLPSGSKLIEILAEQNCFIAFGGAAVEADAAIADDASRFFLLGVQVAPVPLDPATGNVYTHLAVIWQAVAGVFQIEQLI